MFNMILLQLKALAQLLDNYLSITLMSFDVDCTWQGIACLNQMVICILLSWLCHQS